MSCLGRFLLNSYRLVGEVLSTAFSHHNVKRPLLHNARDKIPAEEKESPMQAGHLDEASAMAKKISGAISRQNRRELRQLDAAAGTKNLWCAVNNITKSKAAKCNVPTSRPMTSTPFTLLPPPAP